MVQLLIGMIDDREVVERLSLVAMMKEHLTNREHAVLALRASGYTRNSIVELLGVGKTTIYTCELRAMERLRDLIINGDEPWTHTDAYPAENI